jgi:hypothetical protein
MALLENIFTVRDDGPLPGLSDIIPTGRELSETEVEDLVRKVSEADLPFQATLGLRETWASLVRSFSRRQLLRELPDDELSMPWLQIHVPPGGTTLVRLSTSESESSSLTLSVFGSGFGRGRAITVTLASASEPRSVCATYSLTLRVRPRIYDKGGIESVEVDVRELLGTSVEPLSPCPCCSVNNASVDLFDFKVEPYFDLRRDTVAITSTERIEAQEETTIDAGFSLPMLPAVALKLTAKVKRVVAFETESTLPPGHLYRPFRRRLLGAPLHSRMWAVDD